MFISFFNLLFKHSRERLNGQTYDPNKQNFPKDSNICKSNQLNL